MSVKNNPLVMVIEESIRLKDSAQVILSEAMEGAHLSRIERLVLLMITEADAPMTASQMGRALGHTRQVIQRAANQLVSLQLIRKIPNPEHKASSLFEPTSKGMTYEARMGASLQEIVASLLSEKDAAMCLRLSRELKKLREAIEAYQPDS